MERVFIKINSGWFKRFYLITWPGYNGKCEVYSREPISFTRSEGEMLRDCLAKDGTLVELVKR